MQDTVSETLTLLERRLARLQFYLGTGEDINSSEQSDAWQNTGTIKARLAKLEARFEDVCSQSPATRELLNLHAHHPELTQQGLGDANPAASAVSQKQQVLLSSVSAYTTAQSGLKALQETSMPDGETIAALVALKPRLRKAEVVQEAQLRELQELRDRSATLLLQWHRQGILQNNEQWVLVEDRLAKMEQVVRRKEAAIARQQNQI